MLTYGKKGIFVILLSFITVACSIMEEKDIVFIRQHVDQFDVQTVPYEEKVKLELTTEEILNGLEEPIKLNTIHNTDVYLTEIVERENSLNGNAEVIINIGFDSVYQSPNGTMISLFQLNPEENTYTTGDVKLEAFDNEGEPTSFGSGMGDHEGEYEQFVGYVLEKETLMTSDTWTFEISGLNLLHYSEK
ncbi:hypothetical protein [Bacillus sp. AK128]